MRTGFALSATAGRLAPAPGSSEPESHHRRGGVMRGVMATLMALTLFQAGASHVAAQADNCAAFVGQFTTGPGTTNQALNGLCLAGDTLPLGNGIRLPFGFLPPGATPEGA